MRPRRYHDTETKVKGYMYLVLGLLSFFVLANVPPTSNGPIELIDDAIPYFGNLDEALATLIFLGVLRSFGLDLLQKLMGDPPDGLDRYRGYEGE
jgi:hypothetical protein